MLRDYLSLNSDFLNKFKASFRFIKYLIGEKKPGEKWPIF